MASATVNSPKVRLDPIVHRDLALLSKAEGREMKDLATEAIRDMIARRRIKVTVTETAN